MFVAALFLYADAQAFGTAAIFGMVQDLGLYTLSVVDGAISIDLSRYSMASGIYYLGAIAVSRHLYALATFMHLSLTFPTGHVSASLAGPTVASW